MSSFHRYSPRGSLCFLSNKTVKENMTLRTQFQMLIFVQPLSNQLMFSYVSLLNHLDKITRN